MFPDQNQVASIGDGLRRWSFFRRQQPFSKKSHITYLIETHVTMFIQRSLKILFQFIDLKKKVYFLTQKNKIVNR